jgi:hypothetical protein
VEKNLDFIEKEFKDKIEENLGMKTNTKKAGNSKYVNTIGRYGGVY